MSTSPDKPERHSVYGEYLTTLFGIEIILGNDHKINIATGKQIVDELQKRFHSPDGQPLSTGTVATNLLEEHLDIFTLRDLSSYLVTVALRAKKVHPIDSQKILQANSILFQVRKYLSER